MTAGQEQHGGAAVVDVLRAKGVSQFFNVPGESFLPVLDSLRTQDQVHVVTNRHESGAAFAAEGFAKISGRPAVCMATRGPGASNLTIGIHTAHYDRTPLVALVGLIPTALQGTGAFQDFDLPSMFVSMAKRAVVVPSRAALASVLSDAIDEASSGRPGPVVVGLPTDVLAARARAVSVSSVTDDRTTQVDIGPLLDLLEGAEHPAFVVSTGPVRGAAAHDLAAVASERDIPVVCGWRRFSSFDNGHPCFAGSLGLGMASSVREALDRADLVVAFGALEQITIESGHLNRAALTVVNVDAADDPELDRRLPLARLVKVIAVPEPAARALAAALVPKGPSDEPPPRTAPRTQVAAGNLPDAVVASLDRRLPADAILVSDAGDFAHSILRTFRFDHDRSFIGPVVGAMGYGLPASMGARLAAPSRPVYCLAGDGGLLMTIGEMETAVRIGVELTAIVFNNRAYGTIQARQAVEFPGAEFATSLGEVSFAGIAKAMGWSAWTASTPQEFEAALGHSEEAGGCRLIEVEYGD